MKTKKYLKGLRAQRKSIGLTQTQLAERLGTAQNTVASWESGERLPAADKLPGLADALNCTIDQLFHDSEEVRE